MCVVEVKTYLEHIGRPAVALECLVLLTGPSEGVHGQGSWSGFMVQ